MYLDLIDNMKKMRNDMNKVFGPYYMDYDVYPLLNVYDKEENIEIEALIPGVKREDIELTYENNLLTIKVNKSNGLHEQHKYIRQEREYGKFERVLKINIPIEPNSIEAKVDNGILNIKMKKSEEAKPKKIQIN